MNNTSHGEIRRIRIKCTEYKLRQIGFKEQEGKWMVHRHELENHTATETVSAAIVANSGPLTELSTSSMETQSKNHISLFSTLKYLRILNHQKVLDKANSQGV